jgi:transcriptional regulator with XRE-family HTH domain
MAQKLPPPLAERLQTAREAAILTQSDFARAVGVHASTVSRWERGISEPTVTELLAIAKITGCTVMWLATGIVDSDGAPEHHSLPRVLREFLETPIGTIAREKGLTLKLRHLQTDLPPSIALYEALTIALVSTLSATTRPQTPDPVTTTQIIKRRVMKRRSDRS